MKEETWQDRFDKQFLAPLITKACSLSGTSDEVKLFISSLLKEQSLTIEENLTIRQTIGLLCSMVDCREEHSDASIQAVEDSIIILSKKEK
jgi:hypothetical protein